MDNMIQVLEGLGACGDCDRRMADPRLAGLGAGPVYAPALAVAGAALLAAWLLSRRAKRR